MDRFEAMSLLVDVVDAGSLSAAGRARHMPLSTVSRKLTELETLLGAKLLVRGTRQLALTELGETYLAAARRLLDDLRTVEREVAGEMIAPRGELVVTAPVMFGRLHVLPVVLDFLQRFPEIDVRLLLGDRNLQLVDDQIDMAIRIGAPTDEAVIGTRIGSMRTVVCASPSHLDRHGRPVHPSDIAALPCIINDTPMNAAGWLFSSDGAPLSVPCRARLSVSNAEAAMGAACRGAGFVRLFHYQVANAIDGGLLEIVLEAFEPEPAPIHVLHAPRGKLPLKMRSFLDFSAPQFRQRLRCFAA